MKKKIRLYSFVLSALLMTGCGLQPETTSTEAKQYNSEIKEVYDAYKANGGTLDYDTWLESIKGKDGVDGKTPYIGDNGHWWIGDTDTGVNAKGDKGDTGATGVKGDKGDTGVSVVGTHIDENGDLICEMSDGTTINAGHVKDVTKHTVNFYFEDELVYTTTVEDGAKISEPDESCQSEYIITSWTSKNDGGFQWLFSVYPVTSDLNLYAKTWFPKNCTITLDPKGGTLENTTISVTYNAEYELPTPVRENYIFAGWYYDGDEIAAKGIWKGTENVTYYAKWEGIKNAYTLDAGDGICNVESLVISYDGKYELPTPIAPRNDVSEGLTYYYTFDGWYLNDTLIPLSGTSWTYSNTGGTLVAKYTKVDCIKYGLYPQSYVSDETLISALDTLPTPESNGWYFYDGSYYAKTSAKPYDSSYKFDDGTTIVDGTTYWFKCEPITWKMLSSEDGTYSLVSTELLDAHCYYYSTDDERTIDGKTVYPNNYKYSDIRTWLNDTFYNMAFSLDDSYIQTVEVDNSAATTNSSRNTYACENTYDKVYLLSYQDYDNASYFADNASRYCKPTDWARANGTFMCTEASYSGNGWYWTRSPDYFNYSPYASSVDYDGRISRCSFDYGYVSNLNLGVRPAITIKL